MKLVLKQKYTLVCQTSGQNHKIKVVINHGN